MSGSGIEVNIVKRITSLPSVFMLKHYSGQIIKIATDDQSFVDCSKYVSRSGATFDGCLTYDGIFVKETRGIYYTPGVPLTEIHNRRKITRRLDEMRNVIEEIIKDLRHGDEKLLIWFDNYKIRIYDKYKKGQIFNFNVYANHGNLAFYEIPVPKDLPYMNFSEIEQMTVYNHSLKFADKVMLSEPYSSPGLAYILYVDKSTEIDVNSPDHGQSKLTLSGGRYYLMVHPNPINRVD